MSKKAMKLALEALLLSDTVFYPQTKIAIASIEEALAKQEQGELAATERQVEILTDELANCQRALEKQEQGEPVAWSYWQSCLNDDGTQTAPWVHRLSQFKPHESIINKDVVPFYTTPQQRKPLTHEQVYKLWLARFETNEYDDVFMNFARAIETAHGITK
jgi:hypothetical protein